MRKNAEERTEPGLPVESFVMVKPRPYTLIVMVKPRPYTLILMIKPRPYTLKPHP